MERWLIQIKISVAASAFPVLSRVLFMIDRTTAQIKMARKVASQLQRYDSIFTTIHICILAYICKTGQWLYPSCFSPTFVKKNVFSMKHMMRKRPSIQLVQLASRLDFLPFTLYLSVHFEFFLSIFLVDKRWKG